MISTGSIEGAGILKTGSLTNQGLIDFADSATSVFGSLTTDHSTGGGNVQITNNTTTFFAPVTVGASTTFHVTKATARFLSSFTNNGIYITDPTTSTFTNLTVNPTGAQVGAAGDVYQISGDFVNHSTQNIVFDLSQVQVDFTGAANHNLAWSGVDDGPVSTGYFNNFALGILELAAGGSLALSDGSSIVRTSAGLYAGTVLFDAALSDTLPALQSFIQTHLVNSNPGDLLNIYYDPTQPGNIYLHGMTFNLGGGGVLEPVSAVPEPSYAGVMILAAACLWMGRRYTRRGIR